jgi:phospholipid/cholesterol/gamma-HCH transport system substrate-binding protein
MDDNGYRFGVGVLVLASAIVAVLLIAFFGAIPKFWVEKYRFTVNFPSAPNVTIDTPVRKNGVLIGRVAKIDLRKQRNGGVDLLLEVDREFELMAGETPRIRTGSLISGDSIIEFVEPNSGSLLARFDGSAGSPRDGVLDEREMAIAQTPIGEREFVARGEVVPDPLEAVGDLVGLTNSMQKMAERLDNVLAVAQDMAGGEEGSIRDAAQTFKATLDNINNTVSTINRIGSQVERAQIPELVAEALNAVPDLFREAQSTLAQLQRTLKGVEEFSIQLESISKEFDGIGETVRSAMENADKAIANIAEISEPISQRSDEIADNLVRSLGNIDALAADLQIFARRLNNSRGTIARLVDDPTLYGKIAETLESIRNVSGNVEGLSRRLQPILDDIRVATDKLARDPGQIGVRGALSGRPLGAGLK